MTAATDAARGAPAIDATRAVHWGESGVWYKSSSAAHTLPAIPEMFGFCEIVRWDGDSAVNVPFVRPVKFP